jgi:uncharacterized membrane protein (DUF106 family)
MEDLQKAYATKYHEYEILIQTGDANKVEKIRQLNLELSDLLSKMMTQLGQVQTNNHLLEQYTKDLNDKLVRIQNDYNALAKKKDTLQTLQGIREHQQATFSGAFFWYSIALFIALLLFFFLLIYKVAAKPATTASPTTTPAFIK